VRPATPTSRRAGITYLAIVYGAALGAAVAVAVTARGLGDWQSALLADLTATLVVFAASVAAGNTSVYDPFWSVAPLPLALWWGVLHDARTVRFGVAVALIAVWGVRLTANFLTGWRGLHHEDWRYTAYRRFGPLRYWTISLLGLQLMPTLVVFTAMLPVLAIARSPNTGFGAVDALAVTAAAAFITLEAIADRHKRLHRSDGFLARGVWAWCRHPNYLGEVGFWWSLYLLALGAAWANWWTVAGPAVITLLFVVVSVPLMDRRMLRRPGYAEHMRRVPALVPRPRRRADR